MRAVAGALLCGLWLGAPAEAQDADVAARRIAALEQMLETSPDVGLVYVLAGEHAQSGDRAKAAALLRRLIDARAGLYPGAGSAIAKLEDDPEIGPLLRQMKRDLPSMRRARVAHVLEPGGLVPEGLAYDPRGKRLLVGDMAGRRIFAVSQAGGVRPLVTGLSLRPLGLRVDPVRRRLWVAATNAFSDGADKSSELLCFDLDTGRRISAYTHPEARSFNDVALGPDGDLYVTDSLGGTVFRLRAGAPAMERLLAPASLSYPNGAAVSGDGRRLYIAQGIGPVRMDLSTGAVTPLAKPAELAALGIDGLYWSDGALIGVQNFNTPGRLLRLDLSPEGDRIIGHEVLEAGNPHFDMPTTAAIAEDRIFVLANSQLDRLRGDGSIGDEASLRPIVILELPASVLARGH